MRNMFLMFLEAIGLLSDVHGIKNCRKKSEVVFQWLIKYIHIFPIPPLNYFLNARNKKFRETYSGSMLHL